MRFVQCYSCKGFGHLAKDCSQKFCNYCKKRGHIIYACPIRPAKKQDTADHVSIGASSSTALHALAYVPTPPVNTLTPEMVQQMIVSASSALGLSSNTPISSQPWYLDFGASNHMTNSVVSLSNVKPYDDNQQIYIVDGTS